MKKIVTVGGGTGSYVVLSGLKHLPTVSLSAIVTMSDDGGSTGIVRKKLKVMPMGDVRQCLIALSNKSPEILRLMNYRSGKEKFAGHNSGNLFLAALEKFSGDFSSALEFASEIFNIKGTIIPVTLDNATLVINFSDGSRIVGENKIFRTNFNKNKIKRITYKDPVKLNKNGQKAILNADFIIVGPGNLYCSIIPNFIVNGFKSVIAKSKAKIILPINLVKQNGHTKAGSYVETIEKYLGKKVDFILINTGKLTQAQKTHLKTRKSALVLDDLQDNGRVIREDLISHISFKNHKKDPLERSFIRHDSKKLAKAISKIINK